MSSSLKYTFALFPNTALSFAIKFMFQYERNSSSKMRHLSLVNMNTNLFGPNEYNLLSLLTCMCGWSCVYLVLSWYLEKIMPGDYGVRLPFYFPFMVGNLALVSLDSHLWHKRRNFFKYLYNASVGEKSVWLSQSQPFLAHFF